MRYEPPLVLSRILSGPIGRRLRITERPVPVTGGAVTVRIYQPWPREPHSQLPLVINFHGGGFVFGNLSQTDWLCCRVADRARAVVVSVAYRMAPEHPAPGPFQDAWDSTRWLIEHAAALGADPADVSVMGASAGGNLAALVALAHRDACRQDPQLQPLRHQILLYPATDLTLGSPSVAEFAAGPIVTRPVLEWYGQHYLPQGRPDSIGYDDPRVSPLHHPDHTDVAPALIMVAGLDGLRDDGIRYGDILTAAGVETRVINFADAIHGFASMPLFSPSARDALDEIVTLIRTP
nr:alpha/beta hydrolase [Microlunatus panaciterrae]